MKPAVQLYLRLAVIQSMLNIITMTMIAIVIVIIIIIIIIIITDIIIFF